MKKNLFPTILISVLMALWGLVLFGYNFSQATVINKSSSSNSLRRGLVAWWTLDGADVTTTQVLDRAGTFTGTRTATDTIIATGKIGQGLFFGGKTGAVSFSNAIGICSVSGPCSMSLWFKASDITNIHSILNLSPLLTADRQGIVLSGSGNLTAGVWNGAVYTENSIATTLGKWHHIVLLTVNSTTIRTYYDGVQFSGGGSPGLLSTQNYIGWNSNAGFYNGVVDDVRVYNRLLSPAEIVQLYTRSGSKINKSDVVRASMHTNLVGQWTFDGGDVTPNTTTDRSGNGKDGTRNATGTASVIGKIGQAMHFDGGNGKVTASSMTISSTFSFSLWFKIDKDAVARGKSNYLLSTVNDLNVYQHSANNLIYVYGFLGSQNTGWIPSNNVWHHLACSMQGGITTTCFGDGIKRTMSATPGTFAGISNAALFIGNFGNVPSNALLGSLDDVRVFSGRLLSPAEMTELYTEGEGKINKTDTIRPDLKTSLVGQWTFDGPDMSGTTVIDHSGNGKNGTKTGTKPITGKLGQGIFFNGSTSDYITVNGLTTTDEVSFGGWVKTTHVGYMTVLDSQTAGALLDGGINLYVNTGQNVPDCRLEQAGTVQKDLVGTIPINDGKWHHVFCTKDANDRVGVYVDGVGQFGTFSPIGNVTGSSTFYIGNYAAAGALSWNGSLDDIRVYNRTLSPAEIMELYRMGK